MDIATTILTSPWLRPLNDLDAIDDLLSTVHPTWALGRIKARVQRVIAETDDVKTFVLQANRRWPGCAPGQHVGVVVDVDGVRCERRYSVSSAPARGRTITVTVKRQPGGRVSNWMHDTLAPGAVLELAAPAGDFVLPKPIPATLLMLSAGSGITPLMAMLRTLAAARAATSVRFVHVTRGRAATIFGAELADLAAGWPGLDLHVHDSTRDGRFDGAALQRVCPDWADRTTLLCGPAGFMAERRSEWRTAGVAERLQTESFGFADVGAGDGADTAAEIRCIRSERTFTADGTTSLLVASERAGLRPKYGCRMGICHTCSCVKRSGAVQNLLTGAISQEPGERIQLCISRARGDVTLDL
jgi:ferredoxin-NADP reductase